MKAYAAGAVLQEMRALRPGSVVTDALDNALATKLMGVLRFRRHHFAANAASARAGASFLSNSNVEQSHADAIAARMVALGAEPTFWPDTFAKRSHAPFMEAGNGLADMAQEGVDATRMTMAVLIALARSIGKADMPTRQLLLDIAATDQARAKDLAQLAAEFKVAR